MNATKEAGNYRPGGCETSRSLLLGSGVEHPAPRRTVASGHYEGETLKDNERRFRKLEQSSTHGSIRPSVHHAVISFAGVAGADPSHPPNASPNVSSITVGPGDFGCPGGRMNATKEAGNYRPGSRGTSRSLLLGSGVEHPMARPDCGRRAP